MTDLPATTENPLWDREASISEKQRDANQGRAIEQGLEPCEICGRGVSVERGWAVHVVDGGRLVRRADLAADDGTSGDMGWFIVGPECGKLLPPAYRQPLRDFRSNA